MTTRISTQLLTSGVVAFLGAGLARPAFAAPGDATRLDYARSERAASCPDSDALKSAVAKRLGYDPFFPAARQTISVEITELPNGGLLARMRLVNEQGIIVGSRELSEPTNDCAELVASLALAISIALDPTAALGDGSTDANEAAAAAQNASPKTEPPPASAREAAAPEPAPKRGPETRAKKRESAGMVPIHGTKRSVAIAPRLGAFSSLGIAPSLAFGVSAALGTRVDWFALTAELRDQFPASRTVNGGRAEASLISGALAPCWASDWLAACALAEAGSYRTVGTGITNPLIQRSLYLALGARAELSPALTEHLRALFGLDSEKSLTPVTLRLAGENVWQTPFAAVSAHAGLELRF